MMNAAAGIFLAARRKKGWTNPYVTDGLVAMWDGEWNAGGGVHDQNATTWVDLSGNGQTLSPDAGSVSPFSEANYAQMHGTAGSMKLNGLSGDNPVFAAIQNKNATVEIVAWGDAPQHDAPVLFISNPRWTQRIFIVAAANNGLAKGIYATASYCKTDYINTYNAALNALDASTRGVVVQMRYELGTECKVYHNANYVTALSSGSATIGQGQGVIRIGANSMTQTLRIFSVRIYSRVLTTAESASNYAIDRERFNLP